MVNGFQWLVKMLSSPLGSRT